MTDLELASLTLAGEFALISWLILFLHLKRQRQRQQDDHAHAGAVREHIEAHELTHREALTRLFENTYGLAGEELAAKVDEYLARERAFYNVMLNLYLNRDGARLKEIPAELAKVVKPWTEIAEKPPAGMVSANLVSDLESEKIQLASELEQTKETLEQLMQEYMAAFKKVQQVVEPATATEPAPAPTVPETPTPVAAGVDLDDIDLDVESTLLDSRPATPEPEPATPEAATAPDEERIDPEDIDAMLRALAEEMTQDRPAAPLPEEQATVAEEIALSPEELEQARARAELDSLADLFELNSDDRDPPKR